jgi:succinyl-diaminopimelate desuccinylase
MMRCTFIQNPGMPNPRRAAPVESIVELLTALVRTPSRAGEDSPGPVLAVVERWFAHRGLALQRVARADDGEVLGLYAELSGAAPRTTGSGGAYYILDATLDTAGFGDRDTWRHVPSDATLVDGWLVGRGTADSKAGAAIFCHLYADLAQRRDRFAGRLGLLLDVDEHSGGFGGARAFFDAPRGARPDGVLIGYPGLERIVIGSRGFLRARIGVAGIAAHSGGTTQRGVNAVSRAARLIVELEGAGFGAGSASSGFDRPPQLTVTAVHGGRGYAQVPDRCEIDLDLRLTPAFDADAARAAVLAVLARHDAGCVEAPATRIHWRDGWPAYRLPDRHPMVAAMRAAAHAVLGHELPTAVVGPSNIGNYLASIGIPALCGFGVVGRNLHAADEAIDVASIEPAYRVYEQALLRLLAAT